MATVENVHLAITASTTKPGYSDIAYSYELHPSELDCAWKREYAMSAVLFGEDLIEDDVLAWGQDEHKVRFDDSGPGEPKKVERIFGIETKILDLTTGITFLIPSKKMFWAKGTALSPEGRRIMDVMTPLLKESTTLIILLVMI